MDSKDIDLTSIEKLSDIEAVDQTTIEHFPAFVFSFNVKQQEKKEKQTAALALWQAAEHGNLSEVQFLLTSDQTRVLLSREVKYEALEWSFAMGHLDVKAEMGLDLKATKRQMANFQNFFSGLDMHAEEDQVEKNKKRYSL